MPCPYLCYSLFLWCYNTQIWVIMWLQISQRLLRVILFNHISKLEWASLVLRKWDKNTSNVISCGPIMSQQKQQLLNKHQIQFIPGGREGGNHVLNCYNNSLGMRQHDRYEVSSNAARNKLKLTQSLFFLMMCDAFNTIYLLQSTQRKTGGIHSPLGV